MSSYAHPNWCYQRVNFLTYCENMETSYFRYFGHACLCTPKMIASTFKTVRRLSACQKQFCNLIGWQHFRPYLENLARYDWWWNINYNISFHSRLFPAKTNDKIFQKIQKPCFVANLGPFLQIWAKMSFPGKKSQFLNIPIIYHHAKNQKN